MLDEKMDPAVCKGILYGNPDPLNSSYRISYNMLLNLMRVEDVDPEYLLRASFHQFQREQEAPALIAKADELEQQAQTINLGTKEEEELTSQYYQMDHQLLITRRKIANTVQNPEYLLKFLQTSGRFLDVVIDGENYGWGVLVSCKKAPGTGSSGQAGKLATAASSQPYIVDVLLNCVDRHFDGVESKGKDEDISNLGLLWRGKPTTCRPVLPADTKSSHVSMRVFTIGLENIERISAVRIFIPQDITVPEARKKVALSVEEVNKRFPDGIPLLDPVSDLGIKDDAFQTLLERAEALSKRMEEHALAADFEEDRRVSLVQTYEKKLELQHQSKLYRDEARACQTIAKKDDLKKMKRVLKKLGHVDTEGVIQTKGRTACEINTADELVVVEMIFAGMFNDLSSEQCVAVLSCMTFDERNKDEDDPARGMKSFLSAPFYKLQEITRNVARVKKACGIEIDENEYVDKFNPGM